MTTPSNGNGTSPVAAPAKEPSIEVNVSIPPFDLFALRAKAPRVLDVTDRTRGHAEVRDVMFAAEYAKNVAATVAIEIANASSQAQTEQLERRLQETVLELAPLIDGAIREAVRQYDDYQLNRVWYRRFWRWLSESYEAAVVELGIREPIPNERLSPERFPGSRLHPPVSTDPIVAFADVQRDGIHLTRSDEPTAAPQPPVEAR